MYNHGKDGQAQVGSSPTTLKVTGWNVDDDNDLADSTNTGGGGFREYTAGTDGCDWSIDAQWKDTNQPFSAPAMIPGTELTNLKLLTATGGKFYLFPIAIVKKASIKSVVNGVITWALSGHNQGTFTRPS